MPLSDSPDFLAESTGRPTWTSISHENKDTCLLGGRFLYDFKGFTDTSDVMLAVLPVECKSKVPIAFIDQPIQSKDGKLCSVNIRVEAQALYMTPGTSTACATGKQYVHLDNLSFETLGTKALDFTGKCIGSQSPFVQAYDMCTVCL